MIASFITLTQVDSRQSRYSRVRRVVQDVEGEDDGLEEAASASSEPTRSVIVGVTTIRSMTARREGVGTRITFVDGGGFSVTETVEEVLRKINLN